MPSLLQDTAHRAHLALTAIDKDYVGPSRESIGIIVEFIDLHILRRRILRFGRTMLLDQPAETPLHHLAHHAKIVARRDLGRADIELAILVFDETFRPGDDHRADGIGAHDVRVVVNLDASRCLLQPEGLGHTLEQARLRRRLGQPAAKGFARILQRVVDQILFSPRCGTVIVTLRSDFAVSATPSNS